LNTPKYEDVCTDRTGHAEVIEIKYNPKIISYPELIEVFWKIHDPTQLNKQGSDVGYQYRSVIFYKNNKQKNIAERSKLKLDKSGVYKSKIVTEIIPISDFYPAEELKEIIIRSAALLEVEIDEESAFEIADRARGTPRVANRLLRRVRDFVQVKGDGKINMAMACKALNAEGIDSIGLDNLDRKFLRVIVEYYKGGPVGIEALAATLNEESDTLVDVVEPYLLKIGFLQRTKRGRMVSREAAKHLDIAIDADDQGNMFN